MLSRSAQSLYWLGRYLERAGNLCRLLQLQSESLVDRPVREIHFGWNRIYKYVQRDPPGGEIHLFGDEEYVLADSFALADDLTFERIQSEFGLQLLRARQGECAPYPPLYQPGGLDLPERELPAPAAAEHRLGVAVGAQGLLPGAGYRY